MAGFTDLLAAGQPALVGGGCDAAGTEGRSWRWELTGFTDGAGAAVDLSTGYTFDCRILTAVDGTTVATPTVTGSSGGLTITVPPGTTSGLANGLSRRACRWTLTVTQTSTSSQLQVWGPTNSRFWIEAE